MHESFDLKLGATGRFPTVLYLAPDPDEPFVRLTEAVCEAYPEYPPYGGAFDTIVPHLTAAEGAAEVLIEAEVDVVPWLPISAEVREALLIEEIEPNSARWQTHAHLPFGQPA